MTALYAELPTQCPAILFLRQPGWYNYNSGFQAGWSPGGRHPSEFVDYVCGPDNSYCRELARYVRWMPPGRRAISLSGWFGFSTENIDEWWPAECSAENKAAWIATPDDDVIDAQAAALLRYKQAAMDIGIEFDLFYCDIENGFGTSKNRNRLRRIIYESHAFTPAEVVTVGYGLTSGKGDMENQWGPVDKVLPIDSHRYYGKTLGTSMLHTVFDLRNDTAIQAENNIRQAESAKAAGYDIVVMATGGLYDASSPSVRFTAEQEADYRAMAAGMRGVTEDLTVILFNQAPDDEGLRLSNDCAACEAWLG